MRRAQGRSQPERRSARLSKTRKRREAEEPGESQNPRAYFASGSEEELVVVQHQLEQLITQGSDHHSTPDQSSPGRLEGTEETDLISSSEDSNNMPTTTRLKYSRFRGDGSQDVDDWFCEFESTTLANQEDNETKARIFQGLLKEEALKWYQDVPEFTRSNWEQLTRLFLRTFREAGGEARALGQLSKMTMKKSEFVRKYGQRVKALIQKLTTDIAPSVQVEWYVAGFPERMGFQIRQTRLGNLPQAMEAAQNYENSAQSLRKSLKRSKEKDKRKGRKKDRKGRKRDTSDSESGSSTNSSSDPSSDTESSESESGTSSGKRRSKDKSKSTTKVKEETDDLRKVTKSIQEALEVIKVNLADTRKPRRKVPLSRANVWCSRCGESGHYASECYKEPQRRVHYVDPGDEVYYTILEEQGEPKDNPVFRVQPAYGRGRGAPLQIMANPDSRTTRPGPSQGTNPPTRFVTRQFGYCFLCGSPHHYAATCPCNGQGQGAPLLLPCQNCGEYGHDQTQRTKPQQTRPVYKQVEVPPRDQTALNYGTTAGIEIPDK